MEHGLDPLLCVTVSITYDQSMLICKYCHHARLSRTDIVILPLYCHAQVT